MNYGVAQRHLNIYSLWQTGKRDEVAIPTRYTCFLPGVRQ